MIEANRFANHCATASAMARAGEIDITFPAWLRANYDIWSGFFELAEQMRVKRSHWSARAVIHVLRWHTAIRDNSQTILKINNNITPAFGRLYNCVTGTDFFEERASPGEGPVGAPNV